MKSPGGKEEGDQEVDHSEEDLELNLSLHSTLRTSIGILLTPRIVVVDTAGHLIDRRVPHTELHSTAPTDNSGLQILHTAVSHSTSVSHTSLQRQGRDYCVATAETRRGSEEAMDQTSETEKIYQRQKYEEIIDLLLSAGYFRARINTLSEFDKVVGGLCWCIMSSGEEVDVDILFQENSTIGQRIALSEAIVTALRKMNCPSNLHPNQIQGGVGGSDFPAIYPVMVWLVKKFFERREEREAQLRAFSTLQFSKNFKFPQEAESRAVSSDLSKILERNKTVRLFKRKQIIGGTEETLVRSCLLEYGETFATGAEGTEGGGSSAGTTSSNENKRGGANSGGKGMQSAVSGEGAVGGNILVQNALLDTGKRVIRIVEANSDISLAGLSKLSSASGGKEQLSGFEKKLAQAHAGIIIHSLLST